MKKFNFLSLLILAFALSGKLQAQELVPSVKSSAPVKGLFLGGQVSTNGVGGEIKYIFNKRISLKSGFDKLNLNYSFDFDQDDVNFATTTNYKTGGIFLLGDFNYTKNLYVTGGILLSSFNPEISGQATNDLKYGDIYVPASKIGDFHFAISPSLKVSPYGGLGLRSFMGKAKRFVLNLEGGVYYLGPPQIEIEATGLLAPTADPSYGQQQVFEKQLEQYNMYPVVKMTFAVRLF